MNEEILSPTIEEECLGSDSYTSESIYSDELKSIFYSNWILVCHQSELHNLGDARVVNVGEKSAIIVNTGSTFKAFYNVCRHRGCSLIEDQTVKLQGVLQCPYHGWTYDLEGRLVGAPQMDRTAGFQKENYPLYDIKVDLWGGFIWINFASGETPSLGSFLGDFDARFARYHTERMRWVGSVGVYEADANWKAVVENANECYHCPLIHPETIGPYYLQHLPFDSSKIKGPYTILYWDNASENTPDSYKSSSDARELLNELTEEDVRRMYIAQVFPTVQFFFSPDRLYTFQVWPINTRKSIITCDMYFQEFNHTDPTESMKWVDFINRQDLGLLARHQKGLDSGVFQGGQFSHLEKPVADYQRLYRRFMDSSKVNEA